MRGASPALSLAIALLSLSGCATAPESGPRGPAAPRSPERPASEARPEVRDARRYGLQIADAREAIERGEGREALAYYERQAAELERRGLRREAAQAHMAAGFVGQRIGEYQRAIRAALRALELGDVDGGRHAQVRNHFTLGHSYRRVGQLAEAGRHFEAGLGIALSLSDVGDRLIWAGDFNQGLARVEAARGDYGAALARARDAVSQQEKALSHVRPEHRANVRRLLSYGLALVGELQHRLGRDADAEATLRGALEFAEMAWSAEAEADALFSLGWLAQRRGDDATALERFQRALPLATRLGQVALETSLHHGIGVSQAALGRGQEALVSLRRSLKLVEDLRVRLQETGLRSMFLENKQRIYEQGARVALDAGVIDEAFGYAERSRARAFLDLLGNQTTLSKGRTKALVEEEVRLRARLAEVQADGAGDARSRRELEAAERAYRAFLERVRTESLEQASLMTVEPVGLRDVQAILPDSTTLLEYLVTDDEVILWVLAREVAHVLRLPTGRRTLVGLVREFRGAIDARAPLREVQARSRDLYDRLLGPARAHVRGERLLIVPHGVLHYLPFAALRTPEHRWLIEEHTLATLPSASVLQFVLDKGDGAGPRALAIGNPDLGRALDLRYAEREARAVGRRHPQTVVLVREEATEARVKALAGEMGLLHFATHGELSEEEPLSSALLLAPDGREDGRLEVREILTLDLRARLVVLSACETGLGKLSRGDELVGLQRAFLYAGTAAVVTTLWKVDDRSSFELMDAFYATLDPRRPAESLRRAQRAAMRDRPHPFSWAAFVLTGLPR